MCFCYFLGNGNPVLWPVCGGERSKKGSGLWVIKCIYKFSAEKQSGRYNSGLEHETDIIHAPVFFFIFFVRKGVK